MAVPNEATTRVLVQLAAEGRSCFEMEQKVRNEKMNYPSLVVGLCYEIPEREDITHEGLGASPQERYVRWLKTMTNTRGLRKISAHRLVLKSARAEAGT